MANPWDNDPIVGGSPAPAPARRGFIPGMPTPEKPPTPLQLSAESRAQEDQEFQRRKFAWDQEQREKDRAAGVGVDGKARESEAKAAAFLIRALGSNESYEGTGVGPRSMIGQQMADSMPNVLNTLPGVIGNSPERQVADSNQDEFIAASLRQDSGAAIPEEEMARQRRIYFPMPGDGPEVIEAKRLARLRAIEGLKQSAGRLEESAEQRYSKLMGGATQGLAQDDPAAVAGVAPGGGQGAPPSFSPGDPGYQAATGGSRRISDPALSGQIDALLKQGASFSDINNFARSQGADPIDPRQYAAVRAFLKKNPDYDGSLVDANRYEPISAADRAITAVGDNQAGSYLMGAGQFLSGNTLDNIADDPERARLAMEMSREQNPTATTLGELSGGVMAGLTGEAALARAGMGAGFARGVLADTAAGAANGAGQTDNGSRLSGLIRGGVTGAAGNAAGTGAAKAVGNMISPSGGSLADLYQAGVRPSIGQRAAAAEGPISKPVGQFVNAVEEATQSIPGVGTLVRGTRQRARDQFQVGAFNESLKEIGEALPKGMKPGTDPHKFAQEAFNRVYEKARSGMTMIADQELKNDLGNMAGDIGTLGPTAQNKLKAIMANSVNNKLVNGGLSGNAYKQAVSDIGKHTARLRKSAMSEDQELADVLDGIQGAMDAAARRHSDPAAIELLDAADAGYAKFVRIEDAASKRGGDPGTFSGTQFDSSVQRNSGGVRSKSYLRGDALMQDYAKAGKALDDKLPNSGTADRVMAGYAIGTTATGAGTYAAPGIAIPVLGAIATANAPGVRNVVTGAMAPSNNATLKAISSQLQKRARLAGAVGAVALPGTAPGQ